MLVRVFACSAVDAPSVTALVALRDSFWCANRGPSVKLLSNKLGNVVLSTAVRPAACLTMLVASTAEMWKWQI